MCVCVRAYTRDSVRTKEKQFQTKNENRKRIAVCRSEVVQRFVVDMFLFVRVAVATRQANQSEFACAVKKPFGRKSKSERASDGMNQMNQMKKTKKSKFCSQFSFVAACVCIIETIFDGR